MSSKIAAEFVLISERPKLKNSFWVHICFYRQIVSKDNINFFLIAFLMCFQNTEFRPGRNCLFTTAQKHVKIFVAANKKNFSRQSVPNVKFLRLKNTQPIWFYGDIFLTRAGNVKEFVRITWRRKKLISENVGRNRHNCNIARKYHGSFITEFSIDSFDKDDDKKVFNAKCRATISIRH